MRTFINTSVVIIVVLAFFAFSFSVNAEPPAGGGGDSFGQGELSGCNLKVEPNGSTTCVP